MYASSEVQDAVSNPDARLGEGGQRLQRQASTLQAGHRAMDAPSYETTIDKNGETVFRKILGVEPRADTHSANKTL